MISSADAGAAIVLREVVVDLGGARIIDGAAVDVRHGEMLALLGANGSGKSTLLGVMAGAVPLVGGRCLVHGRDVGAWPRRQLATRIAHLHQDLPAVPGMRVRDLVAQGRFPSRGVVSMLRGGEDEVSWAAMRDTGTDAYADRFVDSLSGGERQRVRLALALAQDAPILLLDEPTTFLDVCHQLEMLELIARLRAERQLTVVAVLHDIEHAGRYADRIAALHHGRVCRLGTPAEVLDTALLADVFSVRGSVFTEPTPAGPRRRVHLEEPIAR